MSSSNHDQGPSRRGSGRKKITIEKIKSEANRQVTFSKRCAGVLKKANELSTLCGAETAVVVFTPAGNKAHCFGHPSVEAISDRFLGGNASPGQSDAEKFPEAHQISNVSQQTPESDEKDRQVKTEKRRAKEFARMLKDAKDKLDYEQLDRFKQTIMLFNNKLETNAQARATSFMAPQTTPNHGTISNGNRENGHD